MNQPGQNKYLQHEQALTHDSLLTQAPIANVRDVWRHSSLPSLVFCVRHEAPATAGASFFCDHLQRIP